jgi:penicillin amidase
MLSDRLGGDIAHWRWETAHRAVFPHQGLDTVIGLHRLLSRSIANRGDWSTVDVGAIDVSHPFEQSEIPGYRQIVDLSSANDNRFLGSVGQAGHFLSPYYDNQLQAWHDLRHLPMRMERDQIEEHALGRLRLVPQR